MDHTVRILEIHDVTHDVKCFHLEKPDGYTFIPGQATEVSINKPEWKDEKRPFTFTSLNEYNYLELTIKRYADHNGVTNQIHQLQRGDELIIRDVWGTIKYKGPGCFIAGGAGITPFIAILRQLDKDHKLEGNKVFFSNKTPADIIYKDELEAMLGNDIINVITNGQPGDEGRYRYGFIDESFLKKEITNFRQPFYICGPDKMTSDINAILNQMGADPQNVVFEK